MRKLPDCNHNKRIISMIICDTDYSYSSHGGDRKYWSTVTPSIGLFINIFVFMYTVEDNKSGSFDLTSDFWVTEKVHIEC